MRRKPKPSLDAFTNATLVELLAEAKRRAVDRGDCRPATANRYMARRYIDECSDFMSGASQYLCVEENGAATMFLAGLIERGMVKRFNRHVGTCAVQLTNHTPLYLPDFETLLEGRFHMMMAQGLANTDVYDNGLLRLCVATLPYAEDVVRRHLHSLGMNYLKLFVDRSATKRRITYR